MNEITDIGSLISTYKFTLRGDSNDNSVDSILRAKLLYADGLVTLRGNVPIFVEGM